MKKIAIIGHFGFGENLLNGQTIKTKILTDVLKEKLGEENITSIDTHGGAKALMVIVSKMASVFKNNSDIIMLPAHNGLLIFTPLLSFFNKFFRRNLHYVVIGGWLPEYLDNHKFTATLLRKNFKGIYVETSVMERDLRKRSFDNIYILPNYKNIETVAEEEISVIDGYPVKTCTFSRVTEKKGIADAIRAVIEINKEAGKTIIKLDIYGSIDGDFKAEFELLVANVPDYIMYKGAVDFDKTVQTLKNYDLQLFPTKFRTEGIPGSVVESFFAGVPVVASKWNSFDDVIDDEITGIGFEFGNYDDFKEKLQTLAYDYEKINQMKINCINAAEKYKAECKRKMEKYFKKTKIG